MTDKQLVCIFVVYDYTCVHREDEEFVIPELPTGQELVINIRSTWGDKHYVGFTGIEVFTATGHQANVTKVGTRLTLPR